MRTTYIATTNEAANLHSGKQAAIVTLVKPQPIIDQGSGYVYDGKHRQLYKNDANHEDWRIRFIKDFAPYQPGQTIAVRERYGNYALDNPNCSAAYWMYAADYPIGAKTYEHPDGDDGSVTCDFPIWRSPVTMPREAVRTHLLVKDGMCVRVQDMTSEQAQAIWPDVSNMERMHDLHRKFGGNAWVDNAFVFITIIKKQ